MPELRDITQLIVKHLPPSADLPHVRPLDDRSKRWCMALNRQHAIKTSSTADVDATVTSDVAHARAAFTYLRPNGRAIFLIPNKAGVTTELLVEALSSNGLTRILTESVLGDSFILARGERPTDQSRPTDRIAAIARIDASSIEILNLDQAAHRYPHVHLLVRQDPPSRGWDDRQPNATWQAVTLHDTQSDQVALLAFTSLVKATAFMQPAVLADVIQGVNKLPRFETGRLIDRAEAVIINPAFGTLREDQRFDFNSPAIKIDPALGLKSNE
ncbi:MAG TPA: hypothetical protein VFF70_11235 [Anaerolineae bacterium]|nr:hypothetical protein [Anaerolineae bacterium]